MGEFLKYLDKWQVARVAVYAFFYMILFWGATGKVGRKEFNDDFDSLETMKSLRGLAAIGVILHHISQEEFFQKAKVLTPFVNAGAFFVAIFFFCSGFGLMRSLDVKEDYLKGFIKKRIVKSIVLPYYINIILYALFYRFICVKKMPTAQWLWNFSGFTMMNVYAWFPIILAILYLFFYIFFRIFKNPKMRPLVFVLMALVIFGLGLTFCYGGHFAWWSGKKNWWLMGSKTKWWKEQRVFWFQGEWWVNSAIAFLAGLIFANYEKKIVPWFQKLYGLKFHILLALTYVAYRLSNYGQEKFGYWTEYSGKGPGIADKVKTYFCQQPVFLLLGVLVIVFMMKYHVNNPVTRFFGNCSLHTYLMNLMALEYFRDLYVRKRFPFKTAQNKLLVFAVCVFAFTILLGLLEKLITDCLQDLLFPNKKQKKQKKQEVIDEISDAQEDASESESVENLKQEEVVDTLETTESPAN
ncbi:MAG: acyltransferase [Clostridiales bacterium]|nr:acyltransferase [Candidatus Scatonaster coprocaballi]